MRTEAIRELANAYNALNMAWLDIEDGLTADEVRTVMRKVRKIMKRLIDDE